MEHLLGALLGLTLIVIAVLVVWLTRLRAEKKKLDGAREAAERMKAEREQALLGLQERHDRVFSELARLQQKEFFQVEIDEIAGTVRRMHGEIEITRVAEAEQYRKTIAMRREREAAQLASAPARPAPQGQPSPAYAPA
ncbi:hypothetical protein [Sorangium sp. So ce117]|uniref:hypothetical protein n=1 Tax=Sorangium sp. So ce117 TaxID=3133277 RepID=UPI003F613594